MTEEERLDEIDAVYERIWSANISCKEAYENFKKYSGEYKYDVASLLAYDIRRMYCEGYYRYGKKQTDIHLDVKEMYLELCDKYELAPDGFDAAINAFFKGNNDFILPTIRSAFENVEKNSKGDPPNEVDFCHMFLDYYKEGYEGFWSALAELSREFHYDTNAELSELMSEFYSCEDNNAAIDLLLAFTQNHHEYSLPNELLGCLYSAEKLWYNAIQCFEKVRGHSIFFPFDIIEFDLGWAYGKVKEHRQEEKAYRKCLEIYPGAKNALNNLGYCLYQQKRYDEAVEVFLHCIEEKRDLAYAPNNLVRCYIRMGLYEDARKFIAEHDFKISKSITDQLDKKPNKNVKIVSNTIDESVDIDDSTVQAEEEVKTKFFEKKSQFSSEKVLEDELSARLENGQSVFGLNIHIYRKKGDYYGRQYPCANGKWRLDLLCEDDDENLYIIELKKDSGYDDAFEQTKQYVDWFEKHKVKKGKKVYGIIVLNSPKKALIEKVRADERIRLYEYHIAYQEIK